MAIRVAIVDDDSLFRDRLADLLRHAPQICVEGVYPSAEQALKQIPTNPPDVVLMDVNLPGVCGVECTFRLRKLFPRLSILMLTVYDGQEQIFRALEMGAGGYLLKRSKIEEITAAIHDVQNGGAPMSSYVARQVVQSFSRRAAPEVAKLSPRELDVLALVSKGYLNKEVAAMLSISSETVKSSLRTIYQKLHVRSRTEASMRYFGCRKGL